MTTTLKKQIHTEHDSWGKNPPKKNEERKDSETGKKSETGKIMSSFCAFRVLGAAELAIAEIHLRLNVAETQVQT